MRSARCSAVGTDSLQNKTHQLKLERNERDCDTANANPLSRFHLLSGLSLYALSQRPSSLRFAFSRSSDRRRIARNIFHITAPRILSGLNRIRHRNALMSRRPSIFFFIEVSAWPLCPGNRSRGYSRRMDTGVGSGKP